MTVLGFEHVGIQVANMKESILFYKEIIGLTLLDQFTHPDGDKQLAFLGVNNEVIVELIEGYNSSLPAEGKVHHVAFQVDDIKMEKERLEQLDVEWIAKEITVLPNGSKYLFFSGPDNEWIEFFERH